MSKLKITIDASYLVHVNGICVGEAVPDQNFCSEVIEIDTKKFMQAVFATTDRHELREILCSNDNKIFV